MKIFGKSLSDYFSFQKGLMILILLVGLTRLGMTLAGVDDSVVKWFSLTALALVGIIFCAVKVPRTGFGTYRHLIPLYVMQAATGNLIIVAGIVISASTGKENVFTRPEYSGPMASNQWLHAGAHLVDGFIIGPLIAFVLGSVIMFMVKKLSPARSVNAAA